MPNHLIFIRHFMSRGNEAMHAEKNHDMSHYTDAYVNTPGSKWGLSSEGLRQASPVGNWLQEQEHRGMMGSGPRLYLCSPLLRTRLTAKNLALTDDTGSSVRWRLNRSLRERDWGDIETMPRTKFETDERYAQNARKKRIDPLYWRPAGGESIADVADHRCRNVFDTLHRENDGDTVYAVSHGETMRAALLALTRASDEDYETWAGLTPPTEQTTKIGNLFGGRLRIGNGEVIHLARNLPGEKPQRRISYLRRWRPELENDNWVMRQVQDWTFIPFYSFTNDELASF